MDKLPDRRSSMTSPAYSPSSKSSFETNSSSYATIQKYAGGISAFSSVADLKAHLRKNELIREERKRVHREYMRQQQEQLQQQQLQLQHVASGTQSQYHPWSNLATSSPKSDDLNKQLHHKHINFVHAPNEADLALLSSGQTQYHPFLSPIQEPRREDELRDDKVYHDTRASRQCHRYTRERPALQYVITSSTKNDNDHDCDENASDTSDITTSGRKNLASEIMSAPSQPLPGSTTPKIINKNGTDKKYKKKQSVVKPLRKMAKKVWEKVKPLFTCKTKLFKRKEKLELERAKGNLC